MKRVVTLLLLAACLSTAKDGAFHADQSGHFLLDRNGKPFLWLGDTAWLLFQMTTREDADLYLRTRAQQGFTVIQAALSMAEIRVTRGKGVLCPNRYGKAAFKDTLTLLVTHDHDYWDHAEYIIDEANQKGLVLALLPIFIASPGDGYRYLTPETAEPYGRFLGQRFGRKPNVIWVLGGDNIPDTAAKREVWDRLARGISEGSGGRVGMTYHICSGQSTSAWLHTAPWLDFNMLQTWSEWDQIFPRVKADYERVPHKPIVMAEGAYENGPQYPTKPINALLVRRQAYFSYFAGGGHTYGNTDVWNFSSFKDEATEDWKQALRSPGASSLTILRRFFDSLPWWDFVLYNSVLPGGAAIRSHDGSRVLIYFPDRKSATIRVDQFAGGRKIDASWFNPATGEYVTLGTVSGRHFTPPEGFEDAVLILERKSRS